MGNQQHCIAEVSLAIRFWLTAMPYAVGHYYNVGSDKPNPGVGSVNGVNCVEQNDIVSMSLMSGMLVAIGL